MTVRFRGRELTHPEIGRNLIAKFVDRVKDHGVAERTPLLEGKSMHITMASIHKPKGHDGSPRTAERPAGRRPPADAAWPRRSARRHPTSGSTSRSPASRQPSVPPKRQPAGRAAGSRAGRKPPTGE